MAKFHQGKNKIKKISFCHPLVTSEFPADMLHVLKPHETLNALFSQVGAVWGDKSGRAMSFRVKQTWVHMTALSITNCVTLSKMLNLTESQLIICKMEIITSTYGNIQANNAHEIKYTQHSDWSTEKA